MVISDPQHTQCSNLTNKRKIGITYTLMKAMFPPGYHQNDFVATHSLGKIMYGYTLLVPINQRVVNKLSNELYISGHKCSTTHRVLKSHKRKIEKEDR